MPMEENPFESIKTCMATHVRDWSEDNRDAWMYGIVFGWDSASMKQLSKKFGWQRSDVERLKRLRKAYKNATTGK